MKDTRYNVCLVLLTSLLLMLTGCSRRDVLDEYPVSGIQIKLDWSGVTDKLPDGMRAIFYPKDAEGRKMDAYFSAKGGEVKIPPGRYSMVIYNYNTETVQIRGEEAYETIEAFTGHCSGVNYPDAGQMVWEPDPLYVVSVEDLNIRNSNELLQFDYKPKLVVNTYSFSTEAAGLNYVANVVGYVEGMADCYRLGTGKKSCSGCPIYFELSRSGNMIKGSFSAYGSPATGGATRADALLKLTLAFVKVDYSIQKVEMDITEVIKAIEETTDPGGEGGGDGGKIPEIQLPVEEGGIEVEKPTSPPVDDGGIGGDVGDWGEEDNVEIPIK